MYFHDIRAPQAVRDAWAAQQKAGIGWNEVYRKYVRVEAPVPGAGAGDCARPQCASRATTRSNWCRRATSRCAAGTEAEFLALADGKPAAGIAVEFVSLRSPLGLWKQTDAEGRIRLALPFAGEWLLRSTVLNIPASPQEPWRSAFATLTVQVR